MTSKKYIYEVAKRLKCAPDKRRELQQKVMSDVNKSLKKGSTMEDIEKSMGTPKELAAKLNNSLSEEEVQEYKKSKRKNFFVTALVFLITFGLFFWWWWPKTSPIEKSKVFQEATLQSKAEEVIAMVYEEEYTELSNCSNAALKATFDKMTEKDWDEAKARMSFDWGEFKSVGNVTMTEVTQMGAKLATIKLDAYYENVTIHYTLSFDDGMQLAGLYLQ